MPSRDNKILSTLVKRMKAKDEDPLRPLIDAYMIKRGLVPPEQRAELGHIDMIPRPRPPGRLSPSSIGGCQRQAAFKFIGSRGRRRLDPDLEAIFDQGTWIHHKWQYTFRDMELVLGPDIFKVISTEAAVRFAKLFIAGNSDNVLAIRGERRVLDTKSIADYGFTAVFTADAPKDEHVSQLTTYMRAHRIYHGLIHYENKNNQRTRTFKVDWDKDRWEWIRNWCAEVLRRMMKEQLPPMHPDCDAGNFLWEKCPYANLCYGSLTPVQLTKKTYEGFQGVKAQWITGNLLTDDETVPSSSTTEESEPPTSSI